MKRYYLELLAAIRRLQYYRAAQRLDAAQRTTKELSARLAASYARERDESTRYNNALSVVSAADFEVYRYDRLKGLSL